LLEKLLRFSRSSDANRVLGLVRSLGGGRFCRGADGWERFDDERRRRGGLVERVSLFLVWDDAPSEPRGLRAAFARRRQVGETLARLGRLGRRRRRGAGTLGEGRRTSDGLACFSVFHSGGNCAISGGDYRGIRRRNARAEPFRRAAVESGVSAAEVGVF